MSLLLFFLLVSFLPELRNCRMQVKQESEYPSTNSTVSRTFLSTTTNTTAVSSTTTATNLNEFEDRSLLNHNNLQNNCKRKLNETISFGRIENIQKNLYKFGEISSSNINIEQSKILKDFTLSTKSYIDDLYLIQHKSSLSLNSCNKKYCFDSDSCIEFGNSCCCGLKQIFNTTTASDRFVDTGWRLFCRPDIGDQNQFLVCETFFIFFPFFSSSTFALFLCFDFFSFFFFVISHFFYFFIDFSFVNFSFDFCF